MIEPKIAPEVSIVMPAYNRAGYILKTIESIRNQSFRNWELIILDHGSDDHTGELISFFNDERIFFERVDRSKSLSLVRKKGIEKASGEFIALMDSDDLWCATKLEEQLQVLKHYKEAGFCLTGGYNFVEEGVPVDYFYNKRDGIKYGDLFTSFFTSELAMYSQALMFRKECLNISDFKGTDNDVDFILRLAKNFKGVINYQPLVFRRLHKNNYSNSIWKKNYAKGIDAIHSNKMNVTPAIIRNAFFRLYINYGEDCLKNKEQKKAVQNFFRAWKNKPLSIVPFKKTGKAMLQYLKG